MATTHEVYLQSQTRASFFFLGGGQTEPYYYSYKLHYTDRHYPMSPWNEVGLQSNVWEAHQNVPALICIPTFPLCNTKVQPKPDGPIKKNPVKQAQIALKSSKKTSLPLSCWSNYGERKDGAVRTFPCIVGKQGHQWIYTQGGWKPRVPRGPHLWRVHWRCRTWQASQPRRRTSSYKLGSGTGPHCSSCDTGTPSPHAILAPLPQVEGTWGGSLRRWACGASWGSQWSQGGTWSCCSWRRARRERGGGRWSKGVSWGTGSSGWCWGFRGWWGSRGPLGETWGSSGERLEPSGMSSGRSSVGGTPVCSSSPIASSGLEAQTLSSLAAGSTCWSSHSVLLMLCSSSLNNLTHVN